MKPLGNDIYECEYCHELFQEIQQPAPQAMMQVEPQATEQVSQYDASDDLDEENEGSSFMKRYVWPMVAFLVIGFVIITFYYVKASNQIEGTWHETGEISQVKTVDGGIELTITANFIIDCDYRDDDTYSQKINVIITSSVDNTKIVTANILCTDTGTWSLSHSKDSKGTGKYAFTRAVTKKFDLLEMESTEFHIDDFNSDAPGLGVESIFKNVVTSLFGGNSVCAYKIQNATETSMELVDEDGYVFKCTKKQ